MQSITEERTEENNFIYTRPYASLNSFKTEGGKFRDEFICENCFKTNFYKKIMNNFKGKETVEDNDHVPVIIPVKGPKDWLSHSVFRAIISVFA